MVPYGERGASKCYTGCLNGGIKPSRIFINDTKLYTNDMNVLANSSELSKYIEMRNKIESLFNKKINSKTVYKKYIKTRISSYNKIFLLL